jgi:hypothetical protein
VGPFRHRRSGSATPQRHLRHRFNAKGGTGLCQADIGRDEKAEACPTVKGGKWVQWAQWMQWMQWMSLFVMWLFQVDKI